ncbi:MAG: hypothetical protein ABSH47_10155 [Bryobacteraceae bacterium]|jgi:hypothetical protein
MGYSNVYSLDWGEAAARPARLGGLAAALSMAVAATPGGFGERAREPRGHGILGWAGFDQDRFDASGFERPAGAVADSGADYQFAISKGRKNPGMAVLAMFAGLPL